MRGRFRAITAAAILAFAAGAVCRADSGTAAGVSLLFVSGQHEEQNGSARASLVPAPLIEISHTSRRFEFLAEGIPPLRAPIGDNQLGIQDIQLSYVSGVVRYWNRRRTFAVGVGETLYNQQTNYAFGSYASVSNGQLDASRVAGAQFEALGRIPAGGSDYVEISASVNPSLHGRMGWTNYETVQGATNTFALPPAWERGSEVLLGLERVHRFGRYEFSYGLRYLNYVARFDDGRLADRNTFLMPFAGISRALGR